MPLYQITGPDGNLYEIEGPEGATRQQVIAAVQKRMASQEEAGVESRLQQLRAEREEQSFYFCSDHCRQTFLSRPAPAKHQEKPRGKAIYTCPMHPEIEQDHPGPCPKCGMALELKTPAPDLPEDNSELRDRTRRFWVGCHTISVAFVVQKSHL